MGVTLPQATVTWSGDDWEKYIAALLGMRYAPGDFFVVPSDDHGDLGMDGVGRDGRIYQCYAPENEPLQPGVRKKKLKKKITDDLTKLVQKQAEHRTILGNIIVERWILVTPILHSKDILAHANAEAAKTRTLGCPYICPSFEAIAVTENEFLGAEKKRFIGSTLHRLNLIVDEVDQGNLDALKQDNSHSDLIGNLKTKLSKLKAVNTPQKLEQLEQKYLKAYLEGRGLLTSLQQNHASIYEAAVKAKRGFEKLLEARSSLSGDPGGKRILDELAAFNAQLEEYLGKLLDPETTAVLATEAISYWLMHCPLDFPDDD